MARPVCAACKTNLARKRYGSQAGTFYRTCWSCQTPEDKRRRRIGPRARKRKALRDSVDLSQCVRCGFIPEDAYQMDVDHINGDSNDNRKDNLQVLCANCHRLKTKQNEDWLNRQYRTHGQELTGQRQEYLQEQAEDHDHRGRAP